MIEKTQHSDEVSEFCRKLVDRNPGAVYALVLVFDEDDEILSIGSNAFPEAAPADMVARLDEMLRRTYAGEGLQS
jgi:hypothetical protein